MRNIWTFALGIIVVSISSVSFAATSTETELFGPSTPNFNQTLTFNKFNPNLGTLNSVKIVMQVEVSGGSLTVDNDGGGPATVSVELGAEGNLTSPDVTLLNSLFQPVVSDVTASTTDNFDLAAENGDGMGNVDGTGPDGAILLGGNASDMQMDFINTLFHPQYIGVAQTFDIEADINQILDFGSVGGVEGAFTPVSAQGFVQVIYDYTPVPEPASLALVTVALGALGFSRRTR